MKKLIVTVALTLGLCVSANAEVWKWVDQNGTVHFGDRPQHANSQGIKLQRYSPAGRSGKSNRHDQGNARSSVASNADADPAESAEGKKAQEYYCNQATEIYASYRKAPRLYKTNASGQREYLSDKEAAELLAETKAKVAEWCD
jgi:hypothetical protein